MKVYYCTTWKAKGQESGIIILSNAFTNTGFACRMSKIPRSKSDDIWHYNVSNFRDCFIRKSYKMTEQHQSPLPSEVYLLVWSFFTVLNELENRPIFDWLILLLVKCLKWQRQNQRSKTYPLKCKDHQEGIKKNCEDHNYRISLWVGGGSKIFSC